MSVQHPFFYSYPVWIMNKKRCCMNKKGRFGLYPCSSRQLILKLIHVGLAVNLFIVLAFRENQRANFKVVSFSCNNLCFVFFPGFWKQLVMLFVQIFCSRQFSFEDYYSGYIYQCSMKFEK